MASWPVGSFESEYMYGAQTLINCVSSFSVVKLILVLVALPLLMYTCRLKFTKNGPRDVGLDNSGTKNETISEKTSDTAGTAAKKRRRRKKKPLKEDSEEQEQPNVENKAREHTDASTGEEVKVIKTMNSVANSVKDIGDVKKGNKVSRSTCPDDVGGRLRLDNKNTKNAETTARVEAKDRKRGDKDPNKREKHEDSWTVKDVKEVKNMGGGSDKLVRDAICLVLDQDTVCRNKKHRNASGPRSKFHDSSGEGVMKRDSQSLENSGTRCDAAPRQSQSFLAQKTKKVPSANGTEHKETDPQDDGAERKNKTQGHFSGDSPKGEPSKVNTNADHKRRGTAPRRGSFDCNASKGPRENEFFETHRHSPTLNQTRRRSFDRGSEKDSRQNQPLNNDRHPTGHQRRRRSSDSTSESGLRQSEILENDRCYPNGKRTRRRSFNHTSENDPKGRDLQENRRDCPTDNRRRRRSSDHTSESDPRENDHRGNYRPSTDNRARRGSSNHTSEDVSREGELPEKRQLTDNRRRRRSFDRTSKSDPRHSEILENHRHPIDNRTRRKSFDRTSVNDTTNSGLPENRRHCPTYNSSSARSEKPLDEYEQGNTEHSTSPVQDEVKNPSEAPCIVDKAGLEHSVEAVKDIKAANRQDGKETLGDQQGQFVIDPEVRERIANPKFPVRVPDKPLEHLSYRDDSWRPDHIKGANKSLVGGLFGRKWREEMERKQLKQEMEEAEEEERYKAEMMKFTDNICPTFMIWGVCHRGDHCPLRHPSYRYLERPPRKVMNPDPAPEEPKRHPNSYAAILEKRNSTEPKEFFNEAVLYQAETTLTNGTSYSKALVNSKQEQQTSNVPVTEASYEEAWPSLGCLVQGRGVKATKQAPLNVPEGWTTQKGPRIVDEKLRTTADKLQTTSDPIIAQELQADEYALCEYDGDTSYDPEDEFTEDSFYHQVHGDTHEDDESSRNTHHDAKLLELEQFDNSHSQSSPVIMEQSSRHTEDPNPPRIVASPCDICMDRPKDATLVCGHRFCYVCALQMRLDERVCAICRRCIVSVIKTYN